jgi:hypothetical protein
MARPVTTTPLPNDLIAGASHTFNPTETGGPVSATGGSSLGSMGGDTIFYAANWYAARSTDNGQTFTYVNPYTTFPSINGGFCCNQVIQ